MTSWDEPLFQLAVDTPCPGVRLIRAVGTLDTNAAARLLRLVDAQLALVRSGDRVIAHLLLDLSGVRHYHPRALESLRHARHGCARLDVGVHLTGGIDRAPLPVTARKALAEFSRFPSVEVAVDALRTVHPVPPRPVAGSVPSTIRSRTTVR